MKTLLTIILLVLINFSIQAQGKGVGVRMGANFPKLTSELFESQRPIVPTIALSYYWEISHNFKLYNEVGLGGKGSKNAELFLYDSYNQKFESIRQTFYYGSFECSIIPNYFFIDDRFGVQAGLHLNIFSAAIDLPSDIYFQPDRYASKLSDLEDYLLFDRGVVPGVMLGFCSGNEFIRFNFRYYRMFSNLYPDEAFKMTEDFFQVSLTFETPN